MNRFCFLLILSLLCFSCSHRVMTMQSFYDVPNQSSSSQLKDVAGNPYTIRKKEDGVVEYEYIERIKVGARTVEERHYIFILKDDRVVARRVEQSGPPPFQINSYDLQTSFEEDEATP